MIKSINKLLNKFGADLVRFPNNDLKRRLFLINNNKIDLVIDVGANKGQYGLQLRKIGYSGKIVSFEPILEPYSKLSNLATKGNNWEAFNFGFGDQNGSFTINKSENIVSSSILEITSNSTKVEPKTKYISTEQIEIKRLDSYYESIKSKGKNIYLKLDVQGFEMNVLKGAGSILKEFKIIQLEMSLVELYKGETLFIEMIKFLEDNDFILHSLEPGFWDKKTGKLLQIDGLFLKKAI